jgi:hypothetical protein
MSIFLDLNLSKSQLLLNFYYFLNMQIGTDTYNKETHPQTTIIVTDTEKYILE